MQSGHVGIVYRVKNSGTSWSNATHVESTNRVGTYIVSLSGLTQNTEYEYCAYYDSYGVVSGHHYTHLENVTLNFTTLATPPTPPTPPTVTLSEIKESDVSNYTVNVSASFTTGTLEGGAPDAIVDYGFCWVKASNGNPSIYNDNCKKSEVSENSGEFTYTISDLKDGEEYNCAAYVKTQSGNTYYSVVRSFTTKPVLPGGDNTGGDWGDEGDGGEL